MFTKNYKGVVIHNRIQGIQIIEQDSNFVYVKVGAGENWHDFVEWSVSKSLSGIENLALELSKDKSNEIYEKINIKFPTGALIIIKFDEPSDELLSIETNSILSLLFLK